MQVDREVSMPTRRALTLNQPDLASPRGYAARFAKSGLGKSNFRSKIAKPIIISLAIASLIAKHRILCGVCNMRFEDLPNESQVALSLGIAEERAKLGKPSYFDQWWYFDTNCISELVKLYSSGKKDEVFEFISDKDILISSTVLEELRRAPRILALLEKVLKVANPYMVPDITRFWYSDIFNFLNEVDPIEFNSLEVFPIQTGFLSDLTGKNKKAFNKVCDKSEKSIRKIFQMKVAPDVGANIDERDLCVYIWNVVNKNSKEWFNIEIPIADFRYSNFPSHYIHFYSYFFRYIKQPNITLEFNDFFDLAHCIPSPYCDRVYCEAAFASILRHNIQGRFPPTALQLTKKVYKNGLISQARYDEIRKKRSLFDRSSSMLTNTTVRNFAEMREDILSLGAS